MPYIHVRTNSAVSDAQAEQIKSQLGSAITAIPGKSEHWLMVGIDGGAGLWFQGSDAPAAMVSVSLYGSASDGALSSMTAKVTAILSKSLGIAGDRIYVAYFPTPNWGWNGSNF